MLKDVIMLLDGISVWDTYSIHMHMQFDHALKMMNREIYKGSTRLQYDNVMEASRQVSI